MRNIISTPTFCPKLYTHIAIILLALLAVPDTGLKAQCTGCTSTITSNSSGVTVNSGQVVCINYFGTFTKSITFNGGTICIGPYTTVSSGINMPGGGALNIYGTYSGSMSQNGGDITVYSGGNFRPSSFNVNGGTLTVSSGGSATLGTPSFPGGYVFNDYGSLSIAGFTLNSGATVNISGTSTTISSSVTNNGTLTIDGPATISGAFAQNSGAASSFIDGVTVTGSVSNNGTIHLNGSFSVGGSYTSNSGASITATGTTGCNAVTVSGSISGSGSFNGGGNSMTVSPTPSCCMSNGATAVATTPTSSPTSFSATLTDNVVSGSFTAPSAAIGSYLVLRYIGTSAPSCSPSNNTAYNTGDAIGTCTVAAIVAGGSTGTKYFTDTIDPATTNCGKKAYYRIFSYSGSGACTQYRTTSPLTGYVTMASFTTSVTAGGSTTLCAGSTVTLTAGAAATYAWSSGESTAAISPAATGTYTVTATSALGCTATASKAVTVYSLPTVTATSNSPVCAGSALTLSATAAGSVSYTYSWSGPGSFSAGTAAATLSSAAVSDAGAYTITVTDNHSCTATAGTIVSVEATCVDSTTTGVNGGGSSDAPCTQILRFDHYSDALASGSGGQNHTWILNNGNRLSMTITRTAGGFTSVNAPTWSGAAFGQSGYTGLRGKTVLYTTASGYSKIAFSNIQMTDSAGNAINNFTLIGIDAESTDGAERDTLVSNGTFWYDYDTITPPSVGSVPSETGIGLSTLVWAGTGPSNARARLVSTNNPTSFTFSTVAGGLQGFAMGVSNPVQAPSALTICSGSSFNANATNLPAGTTYTWAAPIVSPAGSLTGATAQNTPTATVGQTLVNTGLSVATATYTVVPSNNCSGQGYTVTITVNPKPIASIFGSATFCPGGSTTLTASGGSTYAWSTGASTAALTVSTAGTYTVTVTSASGCTATASRTVTAVSAPTATISGTTAICAGSSTTLTASGGTAYSWSTGATTAAITASAAGAYTVTVTNASGCTATATSTVTITPLPSAAISGTTGICSGSSTTLTASGGGTYAWSTGATTAAITVSTAATYTITVTTSGCSATASKAVTLNTNPTASISGTASFCPGGSTTLTAGGGTSYSWSTGATTAAISVSAAGSYTVTVTSASGCTATAGRTVTSASAPTATATSATACAGSAATLTASGGGTYLWSTGATTAGISASTAGSYTVTVTGATGCTATAAGTLSSYALPTLSISSTSPACIGSTVSLSVTASGATSYTYAWTGPNGFTSASATPSISSAAVANSGTYTVTVTDNHTCTASGSTAVSVSACLSVSGYVFDDGNGNGLVGPRDTVSAFGQTLYAVVSDTNGRVVSSGPVSANGSFTVSGLTPSTGGLRLRISTTQPAAGDSVAAPSWPANYLGTLGQYGVNNLAGTGVYSGTDEIIPLRTGSSNITGIYVGFDRLMPAVSQAYTIQRPPRHSIKTLSAAAGLGDITWSDPEDGVNKGSFIVSSVNVMHNNILFYDGDGNNAYDTTEAISGYKVIHNFVNSRLKVRFEGVASINAQFSFGYMDSAGKVNPSTSVYKIQWTNGALPVKLEYFTAEKKDERSATVRWATASEINNDHFEVERSADAQEWTKIGTVKGAGNSNDHLDYSLDDNDPLPGINYYRLKQVDYDGQYEYSDIAEVEFSGEEGMHSATVMTIYPNPLPAGKPLHIALAGPSDQIKTVLIHTALGQQVYRNDPEAGEGYTLPGLTFSAGTYIVTVLTTTNESFTAQIVIQ
ncbi:MAG: T9SS type A sorting domain-containing protein [Bacteroidetes bacterium]|nr:T9SS type A sorting domain-containing protein [Bacteroidota bacterium]